MGLFPINGSTIGKALAVTPNNTIDARSAWLFENQTGTLGTNLNSSVLYVGVTGDINCILSGVVGVQGTVIALDATDPYGANPSYNALSNGSGYFTANGLLTSVTSTVPKSPAKQPAGLTVDITANVPTTNALVAGTGYSVAAFTVTGGGGTGLRGTIDSVTGGGANGPIATFTIIDGGKDYVAGNVLTIVQAGGAGGSITLATAPNGEITTIAINAAGSNYSPGDIITVTQAGASGGTRAILTVQDLAPVAGDAVLFKGVPAGSILPVAVDYVLVANTTATDIVAGK